MGAALALHLRILARGHSSTSLSPAGTLGDRCSGSQGDYGFAFHSVVERDR